jgi:ActR/RegA family two-component response regulator
MGGYTTIKRMLIIEDDENLNRGIAFAFEKDGFSTVTANTVYPDILIIPNRR